jgi:hypothetical protein
LDHNSTQKDAMQQGQCAVVLDCSEYIAQPASAVWQAVRGVGANVMPKGLIGNAHQQPPHDGSSPVQVVRASAQVSMEQRVMEIDDALMLLRTEMTSGQNVPWSSYESRLRVEPLTPRQARVSITCLAAPMAEPRLVEGMLRALIVLSLQSLKQEMEAS